MQVKQLGNGTAYYEEFNAQTGDSVEVRWQGARPQHMTILSKADFDDGNYGGPRPRVVDKTARWQVGNSGELVVFVVAPEPENDFQVSATFTGGTAVQVYGPDAISYGDFSADQGKQLVAKVFELANQRRMNITSRESAKVSDPDPPAATQRLILDDKLNLAAQSHCMNMALQDFDGHTGKDNSEAATRISAVGFAATRTGEILTYGRATALEAVVSWMESTDGHRRNLLNPEWTHTGIGVYFKADDTGKANYCYYWAMVFAQTR